MTAIEYEALKKQVEAAQKALSEIESTTAKVKEMVTAVVTTLARIGQSIEPPVILPYNNSIIGSGTFQHIYSGAWTHQAKTGAYNNDQSFSNTANNYVDFKFRGIKIEWWSEKFPWHGIAGVSIDGGSETNVDQYNATELLQQLLYTSPVLSDAEHTIRLRVTGTRNPLNTNGTQYLVHDRFVVYQTGVVPDPDPDDDEFDIYAALAADGGSAGNPGTKASPKTLAAAAAAATTGQRVAVRGGTYRETITPANNGVTFLAYPGETVYISGLEAISNGAWSAHDLTGGKSIYKATVSLPNATNFLETSTGNTSILANQIIQNGEMQHMARWPKVSTVDDLFDRTKMRARASTSAFGVTSLTDTGIPTNMVGGWISFSGWILTQTRQILSHSGNTITYATTNNDAGDSFRQFYYLTGKLGLLTQAKEWHYESGVLYLWQQGGGSPTGVEYKARNWGFDLAGKTGTVITGFNFIGCDPVNTNTASTSTIVDNVKANYPNHNFLQMLPGVNYFKSAKQVGLKLLGSGSIIRNSEIKYSGAHGIWLGTNCTADNNLITHVAWDGMWGAAVMPWEGNTSGQIITRNTMHTLGRSGINVADNVASHLNMEISYNDIYNHTKLNLDNGAIYGGIHVDLTGTRIHHNWFHDIGVQFIGILNGLQVTGVYLDQACGPAIIDHNVQWGTQTSVAGCDFYTEQSNASVPAGRQHQLYNNTFWSSPVYACYISWNSTLKDIQKNNIYRHPNNLAHGANPGNFQTCIFSGTNPNFVGGSLTSPQTYFQLNVGSPALNTGTVVPGITGTTVGGVDLGAYEAGSGAWTAGYVPVAYTP